MNDFENSFTANLIIYLCLPCPKVTDIDLTAPLFCAIIFKFRGRPLLKSLPTASAKYLLVQMRSHLKSNVISDR